METITVPGVAPDTPGPARTATSERTDTMPRAVLNGAVLAESDHTVVVEGNHYFPPESIDWDHLQPSSTQTVCPWKGRAGYHHVVVDGTTHPDGAWYYPQPSPLARRIRDHIAFVGSVIVEPTDHDKPQPGRGLLSRFRGRSVRQA